MILDISYGEDLIYRKECKMYSLKEIDGLYSIVGRNGEVLAYALEHDFAEELLRLLNQHPPIPLISTP